VVSLEQIARALNGDIRGGQVLAPGPGHSAEDRSLSIALSDKASDGFIVKSFANDDWRLCKDYVLEKLGLPKFQPEGRHHNSAEARLIQEAVASQRRTSNKVFTVAYDYRDRDGTLLYQVLRYDNPKRFGHRQPDGHDGWIYKGTHRRVLYRWPELLQYPDATALGTEGEKDADNVAALGICATTAASGKWTDDCVQALAGRECWILEDNDDAGRKKALKAAKLLYPVASSVKIIRLPAAFAKSGDENDAAVGQKLMAALAEISRATNTFVLGIDHFGKAVETGTRGTSAKEAAADVVLALLAEKALSGEVTASRLCIRKRRGGPAGVEHPFTVKSVRLGQDEDGEEVTSLAIDFSAALAPPADDEAGKWSRSLRLLRKILMTLLATAGEQITAIC
jgi:hypothetical protein